MPGVAFPYFPPRPTPGIGITKAYTTFKQFEEDCVVQAKLNGDRSGALILDGEVYIQNRHGGLYRMTVDNRKQLLALPNRTLLDGEVEKKLFLPFEAVVIDGESLVTAGPEVRVAAAEELCKTYGIPYVFSPENAVCGDKRWEGYVFKRRGSRYGILGSESQNSPEWVKRKW